jgi:hypothetical protein
MYSIHRALFLVSLCVLYSLWWLDEQLPTVLHFSLDSVIVLHFLLASVSSIHRGALMLCASFLIGLSGCTPFLVGLFVLYSSWSLNALCSILTGLSDCALFLASICVLYSLWNLDEQHLLCSISHLPQWLCSISCWPPCPLFLVKPR